MGPEEVSLGMSPMTRAKQPPWRLISWEVRHILQGHRSRDWGKWGGSEGRMSEGWWKV